MARTEGSFIKDLRFEKFYVIDYRYRDDIYVLCYDMVGWDVVCTYKPIKYVNCEARKKLDVVKFKSEADARKELTNLPDVVINGYEMELEVSYNAIEEFLIGA